MVLQRRWAIQPEAPPFRVDYFVEYVERFAYIADEVSRLNQQCQQGNANLYSFVQTARNMSGYIRMVLLGDNNGNFFSKCIKDPRFHPFLTPRGASSPPDTIFHETPEMTLTFVVDGEDEERELTTPGHLHATVVGPLYGLERLEANRYRLGKLLDLSGQPVKRSYWLNTKVLQVGKTVLTAEQVLREMVNREGGHIDEPMGRVVAIADNAPTGKNKAGLYLKGNLLLFGGLSYLHLFTLLVGMYLTNMMTATLRHLPPALRTPRIVQASEHIRRAPVAIPAPVMRLQPRPWIVVDEESSAENDASEPLRALAKPEKTIFRIPGRTK